MPLTATPLIAVPCGIKPANEWGALVLSFVVIATNWLSVSESVPETQPAEAFEPPPLM